MKNCFSITFSGENYFFSYYKLKWALKKGKNIKNVILGFSYHNLTDMQENAIIKVPVFLENEFILLDNDGREIVKEESKDLYIYFNLKYIYGIPLNFYDNNHLMINFARDKDEYCIKIWGGYKNMMMTNITEEVIRKMKEEKNTRDYELSPLMIEYLGKIIALCEKNNVTLYLVLTPLNTFYFERYSERTVNNFLTIVDSLKKEDKIQYLDFQRFFEEDSFFYDGEHLNEKGALIFSHLLDSIILIGEEDAF